MRHARISRRGRQPRLPLTDIRHQICGRGVLRRGDGHLGQRGHLIVHLQNDALGAELPVSRLVLALDDRERLFTLTSGYATCFVQAQIDLGSFGDYLSEHDSLFHIKHIKDKVSGNERTILFYLSPLNYRKGTQDMCDFMFIEPK